MNTLWLNKNKNNSCILFFNGWSMDKNAVKHLDYEQYDVCMFNNYSDLNEINDDYREYQNRYVVAWSLGVWAAEQVLKNTAIQFKKLISLNGTPFPANNEYGIPEKTFVSTLENWNEANRNKFNIRMMGGKNEMNELKERLSQRAIEEQKRELQNIYNAYQSNDSHTLQWNVALIGQNDSIFPTQNQQNWWNNKTRIIKTQQTHYPFSNYTSWKQIIEL